MTDSFGAEELEVPRLGECSIPSPLKTPRFTGDDDAVLADVTRRALLASLRAGSAEGGAELPAFEAAGPRRRIFFDPARTTCALVTCGGLCPGLNDVVRGIVLHARAGYGVRRVLGLRYGYQGLIESFGHPPLELTEESVSEIHRRGGTVLKSSRGAQDVGAMVDSIERLGIDILFTIGGDGTQRGAAEIGRELRRRERAVAVIGVPKTIDNDIPVNQKSFGFETAVAEATRIITGAHIEAHDYPCGVSLVKLMGRDAGFIAAAASVASGDVNFCLVPEVPFTLEGAGGLLEHLARRLERRGHAVLVAAEGAGRELREAAGEDDIGPFLRERLEAGLAARGLAARVRYIDPSYIVRSVPATADDSVFSTQLAHGAVHAALAGRTDALVGTVNGSFVLIPFSLLEGRRKRLDPEGKLWRAVLETTGQPRRLTG